MVTKETVLLAVVAGVVAGVAFLDARYEPVKVPSTKAPGDVPEAPQERPPLERFPRAPGRSLLEPYSDLVAPPLVDLPPLPVPPLPVPLPPVRPWVDLDCVTEVPAGLRHFFFDPAEGPEPADSGEGAGGEPAATGGETAPPAEEAKPEPKKVDLADFDWVVPRGLGRENKSYGRIEILDQDREKGRTKFDLLVDPGMEFTFWPITTKDGKFIGGPVPFRDKSDELGFSDTLENNYGSRRARMEAVRKPLDLPQLKELVDWSMEQAKNLRYSRRAAWGYAARDLQEMVRRVPDDKERVKELGAIYRLLQDFEAEAMLYDWWLGRQEFFKDPEILLLGGGALEALGLRDRARERYEEGLRHHSDARVRLRLGEILLSTGDRADAEQAIEVFARAAQEGERTAGTVGEARAHLALGRLDQAEKALSDRVPTPDRDASWFDAMGAILYARGKVEEARNHFQAAFEKAQAVSGEALAASRTNLAFAKARLAALKAEDDPTRRTDLEDAVKTADAALDDDPFNYYWPLVARAYALRALGQRDRAVESLQEAVAALPSEPYGRFLLAEFLYRDGRPAEARTQFLEASLLSPRFPDAVGGVGRCPGGEAGEAKEFLRRAMDIEPRAAQWPLLSGRMTIQDEALPLHQRLEEARKDLTYLLDRVDRNHPLAQAALGWVRYYQGYDQDALDRWNLGKRILGNLKAASAREQAAVEALDGWLKEAIQKVQKWQNTRIWRDEFQRPDGTTAGNLWLEEEKGGVKVSLKDGAAQFGPGRMSAGEAPALWREWEAPRVLRGSIEVQVAANDPCQLDLLFWMPQGKNVAVLLGLRKTEDGKMVLLFKKEPKTTEQQMVVDLGGTPWPEDGKVVFDFVKIDDEKGLVRLSVNGKAVAGYEAVEIQQFVRTKGGKLRTEVRCTAMAGMDVLARVEAVETWLDTH